MMVKTKIKKILKIAGTVLWYLVLALLIFLVIHIFSAKIQGRVPKIMGYTVMHVATGSMEPTIPAGSYILVKDTPADQIARGDIITFYSEDPQILGIPNTHRVHSDPKTGESGLIFTTKGDNNPIPDTAEVPEANLIGRYVSTLTALTAVAGFFSTSSMLVIILLIQVLCIAMTVTSIVKAKSKKPAGEPEADSARQTREEEIRAEVFAQMDAESKAKQASEAPSDTDKM